MNLEKKKSIDEMAEYLKENYTQDEVIQIMDKYKGLYKQKIKSLVDEFVEEL